MTLPAVLTIDQAKAATGKSSFTAADEQQLAAEYIPALTDMLLIRCKDSVTSGETWPSGVVLAAKDILRQQWAADHQGYRPQVGGMPDSDTMDLGGWVISRRAYGWLQDYLRAGGFA